MHQWFREIVVVQQNVSTVAFLLCSRELHSTLVPHIPFQKYNAKRFSLFGERKRMGFSGRDFSRKCFGYCAENCRNKGFHVEILIHRCEFKYWIMLILIWKGSLLNLWKKIFQNIKWHQMMCISLSVETQICIVFLLNNWLSFHRNLKM